VSNQTERLTVNIVRIQDIRTVAVLLAYGFQEHMRERGDRPGHVAFKLMVPSTRFEEFKDIMHRCRRRFEITLPGGVRESDGLSLPNLGDYERCHAHVRDAIREFNEYSRQQKEKRENDAREGSEGTRAAEE